MACTPLGNEALWRQVLQTDAELRACIQLIVDSIMIEIPDAEIDFSVDLSAQMQIQVDGLQQQLAGITGQIECLSVIIAHLTGVSAPEVLAFVAIMTARKEVLIASQAEIAAQLIPEALPAQVTQLKAVQNELKCQRANADFLNRILQSL